MSWMWLRQGRVLPSAVPVAILGIVLLLFSSTALARKVVGTRRRRPRTGLWRMGSSCGSPASGRTGGGRGRRWGRGFSTTSTGGTNLALGGS